MKPGAAYSLRVRLLAAGYVTIPLFADGRPALIPFGAVSEGQIRAWGTLFSDATDTGILDSGRVVLVDAVPLTPAEIQAQQIAERDARTAQAGLRQRLRNQAQKPSEAKGRRPLPRSEWLAANSISRTRPWEHAGISRASWYRQKRETGSGDGQTTGDEEIEQAEDSAMTMPIDNRTAAVLKAKGFSINEDGKAAKMQGEMTLDIMRLAGGELRLSIDLADGQTIGATVIDLHEEQLSEGAMIPPPLRDGWQ